MQILSIKICTFSLIGGFTIYFWNSPGNETSFNELKNKISPNLYQQLLKLYKEQKNKYL